MILKGKSKEEFQNEEKTKKSEEREREGEEKERERKHELEKEKIEFEKERIQAEERKLKMTMEEILAMEKVTVEKIKVETQENIVIRNDTGNGNKMKGKANSVSLPELKLREFIGN